MTYPPASAVAKATPRRRLATTGVVKSIHLVRTRDIWSLDHPRHRLECELDDGSGVIWLVFLGCRKLPGLEVGVEVHVAGTVVPRGSRMVLINPSYTYARVRVEGTTAQ